jgi:hypothetical protein
LSDLDLTFFVESREEAARHGFVSRARFLEERVFTEGVLADLASAGAAVALAVRPEELGLASIARELGRRVPLDLWLNLPDEDGYFVSSASLPAAGREVSRLLEWMARESIAPRRVGLDLEPPLGLSDGIERRDAALVLRTLARTSRASCGTSPPTLQALVARINHVCGVDLYTLPLVGSLALSRFLLGLPDVPGSLPAGGPNRVVSMVYTSLLPVPRALRRLPLVEWLLAPGAVPAIGVVSSDADSPSRDGTRAPLLFGGSGLLSDEELARDLDLAVRLQRRRGDPRPAVHVFALNGPASLAKVLDAARRPRGRP